MHETKQLILELVTTAFIKEARPLTVEEITKLDGAPSKTVLNRHLSDIRELDWVEVMRDEKRVMAFQPNVGFLAGLIREMIPQLR